MAERNQKPDQRSAMKHGTQSVPGEGAPVDSDRQYPLSRPENDSRFTMGLLLDVRDVLARHGYPKSDSGRDLVELRQKLFQFLYEPEPVVVEPDFGSPRQSPLRCSDHGGIGFKSDCVDCRAYDERARQASGISNGDGERR